MAKSTIEAPAKVVELLKELGLATQGNVWNPVRNNKSLYVIKHKVLEQIAAHKGITFDLPEIIEADGPAKLATILVKGHLGDKSEWSIGEASPHNYKTTDKQPAYPWAMAEKRAKDRVILKLVGLHGDVYSEDEADEFSDANSDSQPANLVQVTDSRNSKQSEALDLLKKLGWDVAEFETKIAKESLATMTEARMDNMISYLKDQVKEAS